MLLPSRFALAPADQGAPRSFWCLVHADRRKQPVVCFTDPNRAKRAMTWLNDLHARFVYRSDPHVRAGVKPALMYTRDALGAADREELDLGA